MPMAAGTCGVTARHAARHIRDERRSTRDERVDEQQSADEARMRWDEDAHARFKRLDEGNQKAELGIRGSGLGTRD